MFSGTDVVVHCPEAFSKALKKKTGSDINYQHLFACEKDSDKQRFLRAMHPALPAVYGDVTDMCEPEVMNVVTKRLEVVARVKGLAAGFPGDDVSLLNTHARAGSNKSVAANKSKRTGKVFDGIVKYLLNSSVESLLEEAFGTNEYAIFENVFSLKAPPKQKGRRIRC